MRILHLPTEVGATGPVLARTMRSLGHDAHSLIFSTSTIGYKKSDEVLTTNKCLSIFELTRYYKFLKSLSHYDIFHFNFGQSWFPVGVYNLWQSKRLVSRLGSLYVDIFRFKDLPILKHLNKTIAVTYQGQDGRVRELIESIDPSTKANFEERSDIFNKYSDKYIKYSIRAFSKYADLIYYHNPDLAWCLPKRAKFMPYPVELDRLPRINKTFSYPLIIGHFPLRPQHKGTKYFRMIAEKFKSDKRVKFIETPRMQHQQALDFYPHVDILIEQFLAGFYGLQAVEFMAMGIPVMTYLRKNDFEAHGLSELWKNCPIWRVSKDIPQVCSDISRVLSRPEVYLPHLRYVSWASKQFVHKYHDANVVASNLIEDYRSYKCPV